MEHKGDDDTNCNWCTWNNPQRIGIGTGRLGNKRTRGDNLDYRIIKSGHNIEKSPGDLRRLPLAQILVRSHELTLV